MSQVIKKLSKLVFVQLTTQAGAYAANQVIGGPQEIPNFFESPGGVSEIVDAEIFDGAKQNSILSIVVFSSKPAGAYADASAFNPSAADLALIDAVIPIVAANYVSFASNSLATVTNIRNKAQATPASDQFSSASKSRSAWAVVVSGGTPTYTAGAKLAFQLGLEQDV